jgi:putative lipoprotein
LNRFLPRALLVVSLALPSAVAQAADSLAVVGTVSYRQRIALPPDAVIEVRLQDTSRTDIAATTIGLTAIPATGDRPPVPFRIAYDPATIDASHSYSVRATISANGKLLYSSPATYPVLTHGAGNEAAIDMYMIVPADALNAAPAGAPDNKTGKGLP